VLYCSLCKYYLLVFFFFEKNFVSGTKKSALPFFSLPSPSPPPPHSGKFRIQTNPNLTKLSKKVGIS